jgi:putative DNA primase/helicase
LSLLSLSGRALSHASGGVEHRQDLFRGYVGLDIVDGGKDVSAADAQELFNAWLGELEKKIRGGRLHPALVAHLAKYRSLMPSLALLFELADWAAGLGCGESISLDHASQAADFSDYLERHARRVYSCVVSPELRAARELGERIKTGQAGKPGKKFGLTVLSPREVYRQGWSGLSTPQEVQGAIGILEDAGWLRPIRQESGPSGGRPGTRYIINPRVFEDA